MADWGSPISGSTSVGTNVSVQIVPSATVHTKGPWVDLITLSRSGGLLVAVDFGQVYTTHRTILFDLAIGAAGSEQVFLSNLMASYSTVGANACRAGIFEMVLPITLPAGTLVRARCQSSYASNAGGYLFANSYNIPASWTGSEVLTYGADTAASAGTTVTGGAGDFVWGSYTQLTASCDRMECFFVAISPRSAQGALSNQYGEWELSLGGAGVEQRIAFGYIEASLATQLAIPMMFGPYYHQVAAGQRLSARLTRAGTSQKTLDFIVYGVK